MPLPRSLLTSTPADELDLVLASGTWPDELDGEIFVAAGDLSSVSGHAFFGDGLVRRLSLRPGRHGASTERFALRSAVIDTPSRRLRELRPEVFESRAFGTSSPFGYSNAANTAPLPWGDRLFATWDAGRPVEVDPVGLGFLGEVGDRRSWGPDAFDSAVLPMYPSSAHPVIDHERGCLWTVLSDPITRALHVIRWDGTSTEVRRWPLAGAELPQSMHTVAQTRDWLVLIDCAFRVDPDELLGLGERRLTTFTDEPIFLVRKEALEAAAHGTPVEPIELRTGPETNHHFAVWDDSDGIRLVLEHTVDTDLAMYVRPGDLDALGEPVDPALHGLYNHPMHHGVIREVRIDPDARTLSTEAVYEDPERAYATQLSAMDWSAEGVAAPVAHHMLFTGYRPEAITQRALALYLDRVDPQRFPREETPSYLVTLARGGLQAKASHTFALDDYATSPCFVPRRPGGEGRTRYAPAEPGGLDGWVVVPVCNDDGFRVEVFDAGDVSHGPVATLRTPHGETMPFLVHSAWMPAAVPADRWIERLRFADDLDPDKVASLPDDLAAAVRQVADELG
ncbi:MAG: carotenoid oxygenase family protein [Acidimicrobiia bacterium]